MKIEKTNTLIEQLMTSDEKTKTGVARLKPEELAELNAWLDTDLVVAPGNQPH